MELVEGPTLAERIAHRPAVDEALPIARQIAGALEAAHEQGIVHRDLKPANVKIRSDGALKVLDFGLAKALDTSVPSTDVSQSPTVSAANTRDGVILGTVAYMSPEQARGKAVDARTDIWAFGCVLFEMLAGRPAFDGATASDIIAAILDREPAWRALPRSLPARVRHLLERCLDKDRSRRLQNIGEARIALEDASRPSRPTNTWRLTAAMTSGVALAAWQSCSSCTSDVPHSTVRRRCEPKRLPSRCCRFAHSRCRSRFAILGSAFPTPLPAGSPAFVSSLRVPRARFSNTRTSPSTLATPAAHSRASTLLTGILQEDSDRLRVSVQLVRTEDGAAVWGDRYDVVRSDLLTVQDQIAQSVAEALKVQMTAAERERLFAGIQRRRRV